MRVIVEATDLGVNGPGISPDRCQAGISGHALGQPVVLPNMLHTSG